MAPTLAAVDHIHDEVRELIRRRGLDPVADRRGAKLLIDEVLTHYEERVPNSTLAPLLDPETAVRFIFDALAGFGPLQRLGLPPVRLVRGSPGSLQRSHDG